MIDFDEIDIWGPRLAAVLNISASAQAKLSNAGPKYVEDATDLLFELAGKDAVIDATISWLRSKRLAAYHGTRVTDQELSAIRRDGLIPLKGISRVSRLERALSLHPNWSAVKNRVDEAIQAYGPRTSLGCREDQVHVTLSKAGLINGFNHYLMYGSEFDQRVAEVLLGTEGKELLARDGVSVVLKLAVPGSDALSAAHPFFKIDDMREAGEVPNIVREFLQAWSFWMAHPTFQSRTLKADCGMIFGTAVPADWIVAAETLDH